MFLVVKLTGIGVGALVQTHLGDRELLRVDGVPVGREIRPEGVPLPWNEPATGGAIIVILASEAPLLPLQSKRLARRATVRLARTGGAGHNGSGGMFTGSHSAGRPAHRRPVRPRLFFRPF